MKVNCNAVVGIDEWGEVWILAGVTNSYYMNLGLSMKMNQNERWISSPINTNYMSKEGLKAIRVEIGH